MRGRSRTESVNGDRTAPRVFARPHPADMRGWQRDLWRELAAPGQRLMMFDYDGTLAPFRVNRAHAVLSPAMRQALRRLARLPRHRLAIVSGRSLSELTRLVGTLPVTVVGEHGWEERAANGRIRRAQLPARTAIALAQAAARADDLGLGRHLERKRTAIVLHVRGIPVARARAEIRRALRAWKPLVRAGGLRLDEIVGGVELRAVGHDKGEVVTRLLAKSPRPDLAVYVGDDTTDEDAFAALRFHGVGVRVGVRHRLTRAIGTLASPTAVRVFLDEWWKRARGSRAARA